MLTLAIVDQKNLGTVDQSWHLEASSRSPKPGGRHVAYRSHTPYSRAGRDATVPPAICTFTGQTMAKCRTIIIASSRVAELFKGDYR